MIRSLDSNQRSTDQCSDWHKREYTKLKSGEVP